MFPRILCLLLGYLFGIFQTAYFVGKIHGIDIREHGSGNAGTTNALRVLGKKAGVFVFAGDFLKCFLVIQLARLLFQKSAPEILPLLMIYAAAGCILGHNFPVQLGFRGGKGIACTAGLLAAFDIRIGVAALITFLVIVAVTRYVSLGSILVVTELALGVLFFGQRGDYGMAQAPLWEMYVIAAGLAIMAIYRHRANIKRLLNGTENRIFSNK